MTPLRGWRAWSRTILAIAALASPLLLLPHVVHADPPLATTLANVPERATPPLLSRQPLTTRTALTGFVRNEGQVDERVSFYLRSGRQTLWLTKDGVVFDLLRGASSPAPRGPRDARHERDVSERLVFAQDFEGANPQMIIEPGAPLPGRHHYFIGNDPSKWRTGVRAHAGAVYRDVWQGVDVRVYANGRHLEQEFVVRPGGDLTRIRVTYRGIDGLDVADDVSLLIRTAFGELRESPPTVYQEVDGQRGAINSRFKLLGRTTYTVEVADYEPRYALVIDPTLVYSTYLGGSGDDGLFNDSVAVDASGAVYVAGSTLSTDFPPATGLQPAAGGLRDTFVAKLDPAGTTLAFATYLGGSGQDDPHAGVALDAAGNIYVAGTTTSSNFPTQSALQPAIHGVRDAYVTKLNPAGSALVYSTYLGGSGEEFGQGMYVERSSGEVTRSEER